MTGTSFQPVRAVRAYEAIVEQVEEALGNGALRPGSRLPSERDLMGQFAVSRSTVREALRVLESSGLIRSRPGDPRGAEVLPFSAGSLRKPLARLARVQEVRLGELVQFRMVLEGAANYLAAQHASSVQLAAMETALGRMREAIDAGRPAFSAADVAFRQLVAQASGNMMIGVCGEVTRDVILGLIEDKLLRAPDPVAVMRESLRQHSEVFEAIRRRDGASAARLGRGALYDFYASYVPEDERAVLASLAQAGS
ncbi:MAG TPA: FCD domain-containing protein [Trebonia sp.]|nr:FCD domain-containing protein [Trebonia sp.]